jgi:DNA-binding protein HU-beta
MAGKRMTKSEFVAAVAKASGLEKKQAVAALNAVNSVVSHQLKNAGEVILPGLLKLVVVKKPAVKAHPGINPFTKEPTMFKAKPARKIVKARPVKALKDAV